MSAAGELGILVELSMLMASELEPRPLIDKMLGRLLFHTGFSGGFFGSRAGGASSPLQVEVARGHRRARACAGTSLRLRDGIIARGGLHLGEPIFVDSACGIGANACLVLPCGERELFLLFSRRAPAQTFPFGELFRPLMGSLGGAITCSSAPGGGSRFVIRLPAAMSRAAPGAERRLAMASGASGPDGPSHADGNLGAAGPVLTPPTTS